MFRCTFCETEVEEDESVCPDARTLVARFNEQIEPIYALLRETEDINLSHDLLEPEPTEIPALKQRSVRNKSHSNTPLIASVRKRIVAHLYIYSSAEMKMVFMFSFQCQCLFYSKSNLTKMYHCFPNPIVFLFCFLKLHSLFSLAVNERQLLQETLQADHTAKPGLIKDQPTLICTSRM